MSNNTEQKKNNKTEILISLLFLPLWIVNIIYGVNYLGASCAESVGGIVFGFPVWLIVYGSCGCFKVICTFFNMQDTVTLLSLNEFAWFIVGNVLFWNGTQDCSGELYKLGLANMIIGYISIFLGIVIMIWLCVWVKRQNKAIQNTGVGMV
jgi:hypothetical protein